MSEMVMKRIAPSILSADGGILAEEIRSVERAGADWIHVDVMDGHFVPNISIGPAIVKKLRNISALPFDVHLMIDKPDHFIEAFADAGADYITVHAETLGHLHRTVELIKSLKIKAGVSLNPSTPLCCLEEILSDLDLVLIMSVNPGFGGQKFIPSSLAKIRRAYDMISRMERKPLLEVDGGINLQNIASVSQAGADVLVAGAAIFGSADYTKTISALKSTAGQTG
ncbi:MAG TPA: ribulose-phosphate 3-epimerase [Smithellaceae bacterium]|nr:ribulose-phosphate 3-epimerase [Smithellaceae bacterium]